MALVACPLLDLPLYVDDRGARGFEPDALHAGESEVVVQQALVRGELVGVVLRQHVRTVALQLRDDHAERQGRGALFGDPEPADHPADRRALHGQSGVREGPGGRQDFGVQLGQRMVGGADLVVYPLVCPGRLRPDRCRCPHREDHAGHGQGSGDCRPPSQHPPAVRRGTPPRTSLRSRRMPRSAPWAAPRPEASTLGACRGVFPARAAAPAWLPAAGRPASLHHDCAPPHSGTRVEIGGTSTVAPPPNRSAAPAR